jgi:6-phosphogluconolactonase
MKITVFNDLDTLYKKAADRFVDLAEKSIQDHDRFVVALSGGSLRKLSLNCWLPGNMQIK